MKNIFPFIAFLFLVFAFLTFFPLHACLEREPIINFEKTLLSGTLCIVSKNLYDFDDKDAEEIVIPANLYFPENIEKPVPAIIMSHGAGGIFRFHHKYKRLFLNEGYAVLIIEHFHPRGKTFDNNFIDITEPMMISDVVSAYNLLKKHPHISDDIGYIGWSKGGIGTVLLKDKRILQKFNLDENSFRFMAGIYTFCGFDFDEKNISKTPLLVISASNDIITPAYLCKNMTDSFKSEHNTKYFETNGSHGFDNYAFYFGAYIPWQPIIKDFSENCFLKINDSFETTNVKGDMKLNSIKNRTIFINHCTEKGAYVIYNSKSAFDAEKTLIEFIKPIFSHN